MSDDLRWYKSSYSGAHGGNCVEVAEWYKSSYSGNQGGDCVEVADSRRLIHIRDTQHRELGHLTLPASSWNSFIFSVKSREL